MKTEAAVLYQPETPLTIDEVDLGPVKEEDVLVRIVASGVCHSDLHVYHGQQGWPLPMVLGHEGAGVVQEVGAAVTQVSPGDHVVINLAPYCGRCRSCSIGLVYRCSRQRGPAGYLYDGETRLHKGGQPVHHFANAATYARHA
ncbi:MAG: alcohol dehydrogenase catalytic domain-containing protein, partial [Dehalococcoidia bacterium]